MLMGTVISVSPWLIGDWDIQPIGCLMLKHMGLRPERTCQSVFATIVITQGAYGLLTCLGGQWLITTGTCSPREGLAMAAEHDELVCYDRGSSGRNGPGALLSAAKPQLRQLTLGQGGLSSARQGHTPAQATVLQPLLYIGSEQGQGWHVLVVTKARGRATPSAMSLSEPGYWL